MGQKVNPIGIRTFVDSLSFKNFLLEDIKIRKALMAKLKLAGVTSVEIERLPKSMVVAIWVSRPGVVIGRGGSGIEEVKKDILKIIGVSNSKIDIKIQEVKNPELSAHLVAERIVSELERRIPHRRVVQKTMERVMASGALGIKVAVGGRIGGAEISRVEKFHVGSVPSQTLREEIDYSQVPALLKRGYVGVKVWIHRKKE
ncbi:MAG: 30S ribosomal protein S3 [Candidatus Woesebacteria bacterium GW2011_GWB1_41_10]|uniref:Small ribosomal subunit protein uS3 n=2 Tax=root TaxID=1 RepID=A0A0G0UB33_9BACT|nr:30S ribosomal protein S3 [uncultured organism]KKR86179.1 MAG: 30S ribosomal protein S3 [Candidatus Woesebacteria bacterium GW2011_GWB1_41_10]